MTAERIRVTRHGPDTRIVIDGIEIPPDAIAANSVNVPVSPDERPTVALTLVADQVDVRNTLETEIGVSRE